jgi:hypothetical protein
VDQVLAASDSSSAGSIVSQKVVNLRMTVDSRPGVMSGNKIEDLAFEVSPENLDMLILELAQAQQMMNEIDA